MKSDVIIHKTALTFGEWVIMELNEGYHHKLSIPVAYTRSFVVLCNAAKDIEVFA